MYLIIYSFIQCLLFLFKKAISDQVFFTISKAKHFSIETNNSEGNL